VHWWWLVPLFWLAVLAGSLLEGGGKAAAAPGLSDMNVSWIMSIR
jgi:hypothetical protein